MPRTQVDRIDGLTTSIAVKAACTCATTTAITLSGLQTIDGVTVVGDDIYPPDRVLVKDQADAATNGIYNPSINAWTRALDFDGQRDITDGSLIWVRGGDTNAGLWKCVCADRTVIIDTSEMTFEFIVGNATFGPVVQTTAPPIFIEGQPTAGEVYPIWNITEDMQLPAGLTGSIFTIGTLPTSALLVTIYKGLSSVGTISFATDGTPTVTFPTDISFAAADQFSLLFPDPQDATGANISLSFVFTVL